MKGRVKHIGLILDGNRRFAKRLILEPRKGHELGAGKVQELLDWTKEIGVKEVESALGLMQIDHMGLDRMDRKILLTIRDFFNGGPVGIESLCATLNEERGTLEDVYEPYLLKMGLLKRTARGREISDNAVEHLK